MSATKHTEIDDQIWPALVSLRPFARSMSKSDHAADDIIQAAAEKAWRHRHNFQGPSLSAWLYRIVYNAAIDYWRRGLSQAVEFTDVDVADDGSTAEDYLVDLETEEALRLDIEVDLRMIPELRRTMLIMQHGLDGREPMGLDAIADELGVPVGTVMSGLHRARNQLRGLDEPAPRVTGSQVEIWQALG